MLKEVPPLLRSAVTAVIFLPHNLQNYSNSGEIVLLFLENRLPNLDIASYPQS